MSKFLKIAIFGLNTVDLAEIKTQILICLPAEINVQWVNIAEERIDLLFVNKVFFNSPGIQKVLKEKGCLYLKLSKSDTNFGEIIRDQLFIPIYNLANLQRWITQNLRPNVMLNEVRPTQTTSAYLDTSEKQVNHDSNSYTFEEVFTEMFIARNGHIQLYDASGFIALIDTRTERVWLDDKTIYTQFNETLKQTYAKAQIVNTGSIDKIVYDLRIWLWINVSRLPSSLLPKSENKKNFKLDIWPQFENDLQRRDNLKIAACFESGANIEDVKKYLNLSDEKIKNFVSCATLLQMGHFIEDEEVKFSTNHNVESSQTNKLKSFFGKLRKKLGL
ncbi:conserved hypothetical protein [Acinetobacter sp. 8I-beige]|uniref:hypothetical protein n=1 Tax=Acinetobacter sp. 8I-beige TaxID=2653125 RepID=UPI0012F11263|nr:hypothetical protein [Acinetobacter sp. 8I-beige]VXA83839.1 conserved hypothetical protein [Acinetobacter sp. 8I-beige]